MSSKRGGGSTAAAASEASPAGTGASRNTRPRRVLGESLASGSEFRSAQDIHQALRASGEKVGLATVYRSLQAMAANNEVDAVRSESGEVVYRRCSPTHHHHLVCRTCGHTIEVAGPGVERWTKAVAAEHGFEDVSHTIEIFGICPDCSTN